MTVQLQCARCAASYPIDQVRYVCDCGGLLDVSHDLEALRPEVNRHLFDGRMEGAPTPVPPTATPTVTPSPTPTETPSPTPTDTPSPTPPPASLLPGALGVFGGGAVCLGATGLVVLLAVGGFLFWLYRLGTADEMGDEESEYQDEDI